MSHPLHAWLALALLLGAQSPSFGEEPLNPAFVEESARDPFLTPANAQISGPLSGERLEETWDPNRLSDEFDPVMEPNQVFSEAEEDADSGTTGTTVIRKRALIDSSLTATWLAPIDGFGVSDVEAKTQLIIPVFVKGSPLRLAMGFANTSMETPVGFDVPDQLYGLQAELRWFIPFREAWAVDLGAGGGEFSDASGLGSRGFRVTGRAILVKTVSDRVKWSAGMLYLGRQNLKAMPVAGLIYTPEDDVKIELLIPRSRIARRISWVGTREHWMYFGLELFGGNSWAIEQAGGVEDVVIYKDNRFIFGYETKAPGALAGRVEAGYVFGRDLSFETDPTVLKPGGTMLLRVGVTY
ncbi:MAG: hypothetical protein AABP62_04745 [Planctomycetota bacterium]